MISAPGANDGQQILDSLKAIQLEFVGSSPELKALNDFVSVNGVSKVEKNREALYSELLEKLAIYKDLPLKLGDIRLLQQDITDAYKANGYPLMSVLVPPQEIVNGKVRIQVNEFKLSAFEVNYFDEAAGYSPNNKHWGSDKRIEKILSPLLDEPVLSQKSLDKRVKQINQNPYRSARVVFEPGSEVGQSQANIQVKEERPWGLNAGYNNHATESSREHRYSIGGTIGNLPFEDHQLSVNAVRGPDMDEFENYSLVYKVPNRFGHTLSFNFNYSDTSSSSVPGLIESASTTKQLTTAYQFPIKKGEKWSWSGNASAIAKQLSRESIFAGIGQGAVEYDAFNFLLSSTFNYKQELASNQFTLTLNHGMSGVGSKNTTDEFRAFYNSTENDPSYLFLVFNYARVQPLSFLGNFWEGWSTETQASSQIAGDQLAGSDQFSVGGANVMRGYQSGEVSGDRGAYITQFLHYPDLQPKRFGEFFKNLKYSAFVEAGNAYLDTGGSDAIWDFGVQLNAQMPKNASCLLSLALSGEKTQRTKKTDFRPFIGCNISY